MIASWRIGGTLAALALGLAAETRAEARQGRPEPPGSVRPGELARGEGRPARGWEVPSEPSSMLGEAAPEDAASLLASPGRFMDLGESELERSLLQAQQPSDLTLWNFFSEGWDQEWVKRPRPGTAQNMALLKVTTNFLEREYRADYVYTHDVKGKPTIQNTHLFNNLIAYGLDRRLMIEVIGNYEWDKPPSTPNTPGANGAGAGGVIRFQLVDTYETSFDLQAKVATPNKWAVPPSPTTQTSIAYSIGGFQDLQALCGIPRLGLFESVQYENLTGPHKVGVRQNDLSYDVSLAETWTDPHDFPFGNLTTFLEAFATTDLDGLNNTHTVFTLTPGVRFWFARENSLTIGADLPISHPRQNDAVIRLTYILTF